MLYAKQFSIILAGKIILVVTGMVKVGAEVKLDEKLHYYNL